MTFVVLFVCTGNICRSPIAELTARRLLDDCGDDIAPLVEVASAGTWGHDGSPMDADAQLALTARGIDGAAFRARELSQAMAAAADLILVAGREHEVAVHALDPTAAGRTFLMTEFARLLGLVPSLSLPAPVGERGRAIVSAAAAARRGEARSQPASSADADLTDPYGAPQRVFAATARDVHALVAPLITLLAGATRAAPESSLSAPAGIVRP